MSLSETDPVVRAELRVGTTLKDKWHLDRLLGVGGMAAVYAATHRNASRVAVKILHRELSLDQHVRTRFIREGYLANNVQHAGVVRVHDDHVDDDGSVFLVMDLLEGETLDSVWQKAGYHVPANEAVELVAKLLDVLSAAHARGIVHRDVKPENVFVTRDGTVKLLDFGVARLADGGTATIAGSMIGTPSFMAPEQALGRVAEVDAQSDLWAVGAVLFSLVTGRFVQDGTTANELLVASATRRALPLGSLLPQAPAALCAVVDKALCFEKEGRYASAAAMLAALEDARKAPYLPAGQVLFARSSLPSFAPSAPSLAPSAPSLAPSAPSLAPHATFSAVTASSGPAAPVQGPARPRTASFVAAGLAAAALLALLVVFLRPREGASPAKPPKPTASAPLPAADAAAEATPAASKVAAPEAGSATAAPPPSPPTVPPVLPADTTKAKTVKKPPSPDKPKNPSSWLDRQH